MLFTYSPEVFLHSELGFHKLSSVYFTLADAEEPEGAEDDDIEDECAEVEEHVLVVVFVVVGSGIKRVSSPGDESDEDTNDCKVCSDHETCDDQPVDGCRWLHFIVLFFDDAGARLRVDQGFLQRHRPR